MNELVGNGKGISVFKGDLVSEEPWTVAWPMSTLQLQATYETLLRIIESHKRDNYEVALKGAKRTFITILSHLIYAGKNGRF